MFTPAERQDQDSALQRDGELPRPPRWATATLLRDLALYQARSWSLCCRVPKHHHLVTNFTEREPGLGWLQQ